MRLSDNIVLQMIDTNRYVLTSDSSGAEIVMDSDELARLAVAGVGYFVEYDPTLKVACREVVEQNPNLPTLRLPDPKGE
jgi:hypothetical protein